MKKFISLIIILLFLTGCSINIQEYVDMSDYNNYDSSIQYRFVKSSVINMKERIDNKETFVIYFGFSKCPWCNDFINLISEVADRDIYYVDCRENPEWKSNIDIDNYDILVELIGDKLEFDDNGIKHLYVPYTLFYKNGKLVYSTGLDGYNAKIEELPENIKEETLINLKNAFNLLNN